MANRINLADLQDAVALTLAKDADLTTEIGDRNGNIQGAASPEVALPYISIGEVDVTDESVQCLTAKRVRLQIHIWTDERGFHKNKRCEAAIVAALDDNAFAVTDHRVVSCFHERSDFMRDPEAGVRHGVVEFDVTIEPEQSSTNYLSVALDDATLSAEASFSGVNSLSVTLEDAALSSASGVTVPATLASVLDDASLSAATSSTQDAALSATLDDATAAGALVVSTPATLATALEDARLNAIGDAADNVINFLDVTLDDASLTSSTTVAVDASLVATLDDTSLSAAGSGAAGATTASLGVTLDDAAAVSTTTVTASASLAETLGDASLSASGSAATPQAPTGGASVVWALTGEGGTAIDWSSEDVAIGDVIVSYLSGGHGVGDPMDAVENHGFTSAYTTGSSNRSVQVAFREVTAGNIDDDVIHDPNGIGSGIAFCLRGIDLTTLANGPSQTVYVNQTPPLTNGPITPPSSSSVIMLFLAHKLNGAEVVSPPSGYTLISQAFSQANHTMAVAFANDSQAGTVTPGPWTGSAGNQARGLTFALDTL